jgi:hypothetical protein
MANYKREDQNLLYMQHAQEIFKSLDNRTINPRLLSKAWLEIYKQDNHKGIILIISLILNSCGVELEENDISENISSNPNIFSYFIEKSKESEVFPLQSLIKTNRIQVYSDFFKYIITESEEILSKLKDIIDWIKEFTIISIRSYRYASTISIFSILQGLQELKKSINTKISNTNTFISQSKANSQRALDLKKEEVLLKADKKFIKKQIKNIVDNVLSVRYQDIMSEIRVLCITAIEKLMHSKYQPKLLDIIVKMTYDRKAEVRVKLLKSFNAYIEKIQDMYQRVVEMCYDSDDKCCIEAINLCKNFKSSLTDDDIKKIIDLAWVENEDIRDAAYRFIVNVKFNNTLPVESADTVGLGLDQGKYLSAEKALMALLDFFKTHAVELYRTDCFIQGLWNKTSAVRSIEAICELLYRGAKPGSTPLHEGEKAILINFLISICKFLTEKTIQKNKIVSVTSTILSKLPNLLVYYRKDLSALKELIRLPFYFELNCLASTDLKDPFISTICHIVEIFLHADDSDLIIQCSNTLNKFAAVPHSLQKEAKAEWLKAVEEVVLGKKESQIKRIDSILRLKDITPDLGNEYLKVCDKSLSKFPEQVLSIMFYWHLWSLSNAFKNKLEISYYILIRDKALYVFHRVLETKDYEPYNLISCKYLCETLFLISGNKAYSTSKFYYQIPGEIWTVIENYMIFSYLPKNDSENTDTAEEICMIIARIIVNCSAITSSHLTSSFIAFYGRSNLKKINVLVKQVLNNFKTQDQKREGAFVDEKLFFSIFFQAIMKVLCKGTPENINEMKELSKKLIGFINTDQKSKTSDKFMKFITDIIDFSFIDPRNFGVLECLSIFVTKATLSQLKIREVYDHIKYYADNLSSGHNSITNLLSYLKKLIGITDHDQNSNSSSQNPEKNTPVDFRKPALYKSNKPSGLKPKVFASDKINTEKSAEKVVLKRKTRDNYLNEKEGIENPVGRTRKAAMKKKV